MEIVIISLLVIICVGLVVGLFVLNSKVGELKNKSSVDMLKTDMVELGRSIQQLSVSVGDKLERSNQAVSTSVQKQASGRCGYRA